MSSKQDSDDLSSTSGSSSSDSSSSRESSPERVVEPAPKPEPAKTSAKKRKSKSRSRSSNKRSKGKKQKKSHEKAPTGSSQPQPSQQPAAGKVTARDIMGADSDIDEEQPGKKDDLTSYLSRRVANGISKQFNNKIEGSQYVDLKIYSCSEIETISPMNRWRHAIVTLKTRIDEHGVAYRHLTKFLKEIKVNFKDSTVAYVSAPSNQ